MRNATILFAQGVEPTGGGNEILRSAFTPIVAAELELLKIKAALVFSLLATSARHPAALEKRPRQVDSQNVTPLDRLHLVRSSRIRHGRVWDWYSGRWVLKGCSCPVVWVVYQRWRIWSRYLLKGQRLQYPLVVPALALVRTFSSCQ